MGNGIGFRENGLTGIFETVRKIFVPVLSTMIVAGVSYMILTGQQTRDNTRDIQTTCVRVTAIETRNADKDHRWAEQDRKWQANDANRKAQFMVLKMYLDNIAKEVNASPPPKELLEKVIE